jgi:hypothetical protein
VKGTVIKKLCYADTCKNTLQIKIAKSCDFPRKKAAVRAVTPNAIKKAALPVLGKRPYIIAAVTP